MNTLIFKMKLYKIDILYKLHNISSTTERDHILIVFLVLQCHFNFFFFFFKDPAPPEIYTFPLPAALPICPPLRRLCTSAVMKTVLPARVRPVTPSRTVGLTRPPAYSTSDCTARRASSTIVLRVGGMGC